jgi:hypothetical protein
MTAARRLAAILATDVVSAEGEDKSGAVRLLRGRCVVRADGDRPLSP